MPFGVLSERSAMPRDPDPRGRAVLITLRWVGHWVAVFLLAAAAAVLGLTVGGEPASAMATEIAVLTYDYDGDLDSARAEHAGPRRDLPVGLGAADSVSTSSPIEGAFLGSEVPRVAPQTVGHLRDSANQSPMSMP